MLFLLFFLLFVACAIIASPRVKCKIVRGGRGPRLLRQGQAPFGLGQEGQENLPDGRTGEAGAPSDAGVQTERLRSLELVHVDDLSVVVDGQIDDLVDGVFQGLEVRTGLRAEVDGLDEVRAELHQTIAQPIPPSLGVLTDEAMGGEG